MVDIGWTEMLAIAVILIVVVGPKDLPAVLRAIGKVVRKVRGMADEFRRGVDDFMRESELKDLKDGVSQVKDFNLNRLRAETEKQFSDSMSQTIDPSKPSSPASGSGSGSGAAGAGGGEAAAAPPAAKAAKSGGAAKAAKSGGAAKATKAAASGNAAATGKKDA